jgi:endo-1,4-beta-xylanase
MRTFTPKVIWFLILVLLALGVFLGVGSGRHQLTPPPIAKQPTVQVSSIQRQTVDKVAPESYASVQSLRTAAQLQNFQIGTAVAVKPFQRDATYRTVLAREFNSLTPENAMKFKVLHPEPDRDDFAGADALVAFAQAHHMQVRGTPLVWYRNLPDWLIKKTWTRPALIHLLRQHIYSLVKRYRGRVRVWDVVNEAIENDGKLRETLWLKTIGPKYIEMAFRWAHEADPQAYLFYNDYGGEELGKKSDAIYALVKNLQQRGVPIHGVGLQMHKTIKRPPNPAQIAANIQRLGKLGLQVQITEMDVQIPGQSWPEIEALQAQAQVYREIAKVCLVASHCKGLTVWGLADHFSWLPHFFDRPDAPLLFDRQYRPKPAYDALLDEMKTTRRS